MAKSQAKSSRGPKTFEVCVPAEPGALKSMRTFFEVALSEAFGEATDMLVLALDEACSNVLEHGSRCGPEDVIRVRAELHPDLARFRIEDYCAGEDVPRIRPRDLEDVRPGGLGTHFLSSIMDRVEFEPRAGSDRLTLVLEKARPGSEGDRPASPPVAPFEGREGPGGAGDEE